MTERNLKSKLDKDLLYYDGESKLSVITSGIVFPKEIDPETVKYTFKRQGETDDVDDVISAGNYQMKIICLKCFSTDYQMIIASLKVLQ